YYQAEDGIRDATVTGVQTCALPILCRKLSEPVMRADSSADLNRLKRPASPADNSRREHRQIERADNTLSGSDVLSPSSTVAIFRSEERRVGKVGEVDRVDDDVNCRP